MTVPTREELDALAETCEIAARTLGRSAASIIQDGTEDAERGRREGEAAEELLMLAADRLRTYPLPAAEGEREKCIRELKSFASAAVIATGLEFPVIENWQLRALERAVALLRAPAGVDLEAVLRLVAGTRHTTCLPGLTAQRADAAFANLLAAIRALSEAKPAPAPPQD